MTDLRGNANLRAAEEEADQAGVVVTALKQEVATVLVGQGNLVDRLLIGLLTGGHILLEGLPGLAKTLAVRTLASAVSLSFQRIQFTPDLLPADLIGTLIYSPKDGDFRVHKGPIFANLVLADEINRAPAKVQSALLEAMQERRVTIGHTGYELEEPFLVLATQNPIEHEGTYPLPEAQLDRFLLHVTVTYPSRAEEAAILKRQLHQSPRAVAPVASWNDIAAARAAVSRIYMDERIQSYIIDLTRATREPETMRLKKLAPLVRYGASPRATVHLALAARAAAFLARRAFVLPEDVRAVAPDVLRHRVLLTYEAQSDGVTADHIVREVLASIEVP